MITSVSTNRQRFLLTTTEICALFGISRETLVADPQAPSGWLKQRLDQCHYRGINQLPAIWYASHFAAFGEGK